MSRFKEMCFLQYFLTEQTYKIDQELILKHRLNTIHSRYVVE